MRYQECIISQKKNSPAGTLTIIRPSIDAKLEALWSIVVIRGQCEFPLPHFCVLRQLTRISDHRVCHYLDLLDVDSPAESILRAKGALRASKMQSVNDTGTIFAVAPLVGY